MKKTLLVLSAIATLFAFVSCGGGAEPDGPAKSDTPANNTPETPAETGPTVVQELAIKADIKWADLGITKDNAGEYLIKATYTLTDASKVGYGPVGVCPSGSWTAVASLNDLFNVNADGVNEVEVSALIAELETGVLFNFWGGDYAANWKLELIKK